MTQLEALVEIAKIYHPGTIEFYAKQNPDPWAAMLDKVDRALKNLDPVVQASIGDFYFGEAKRLIGAYRATNPPKRKLTSLDGFMLGFAPGRAQAAMSIETETCFNCEDTEALEVEMVPGLDYVVRLICAVCRDRRDEMARQKHKSVLRDQKKIVRSEFVGQSQPNRRN